MVGRGRREGFKGLQRCCGAYSTAAGAAGRVSGNLDVMFSGRAAADLRCRRLASLVGLVLSAFMLSGGHFRRPVAQLLRCLLGWLLGSPGGARAIFFFPQRGRAWPVLDVCGLLALHHRVYWPLTRTVLWHALLLLCGGACAAPFRAGGIVIICWASLLPGWEYESCV